MRRVQPSGSSCVGVGAACDEHGLECEDQPGAQREAAAGAAFIGDVGCFVHLAADAVPAVAFHEPVARGAGDHADGVGDVAEAGAGLGGGDPGVQRGPGGGDQSLVAAGDLGIGCSPTMKDMAASPLQPR